MRIKRTEAEIAKVVVEDFSDGWDVYQEVEGHGGIADIVLVCGQIIWVIETKLSLSMALLSQATNWVGKAHYVGVATPTRNKKENVAAMQFLKWKGIGYMNVTFSRAIEVVRPSLNRKARVSYLKSCLCEKQKTFAPAGNADGLYWTPFKETCRNIKIKVRGNPGMTLKELMDGLKHHYANSQSARSAIPAWADAGKIPGVEIRRDGRFLKFYPTERLGPAKRDWVGEEPKGDCAQCGGQCAPECGLHPAGCTYGGFADSTSYWLIADGCELYHGEG